MRVEVCKRSLNGAIIPSNEGRGKKKDDKNGLLQKDHWMGP